ncbi:hypothetical protein EQ82_17250 [Klebsiella pneumoniae]|nr:hypothetical protein EQ82_17250 [Klebsiella pneumoniae]
MLDKLFAYSTIFRGKVRTRTIPVCCCNIIYVENFIIIKSTFFWMVKNTNTLNCVVYLQKKPLIIITVTLQ